MERTYLHRPTHLSLVNLCQMTPPAPAPPAHCVCEPRSACVVGAVEYPRYEIIRDKKGGHPPLSLCVLRPGALVGALCPPQPGRPTKVRPLSPCFFLSPSHTTHPVSPTDRHSSSLPHTMLLAQNAYLLAYAAAAMVGDHSLEQGSVWDRTLALRERRRKWGRGSSL